VALWELALEIEMLLCPLRTVHEYVPPDGLPVAVSVVVLPPPVAPDMTIARAANPEMVTVGFTFPGELAPGAADGQTPGEQICAA
jgi:hypothetical protein